MKPVRLLVFEKRHMHHLLTYASPIHMYQISMHHTMCTEGLPLPIKENRKSSKLLLLNVKEHFLYKHKFFLRLEDNK